MILLHFCVNLITVTVQITIMPTNVKVLIPMSNSIKRNKNRRNTHKNGKIISNYYKFCTFTRIESFTLILRTPVKY